MEPAALLLFTMDTAVRAARQGKKGLLIKVLHELIAGLDLGGGGVAGNLLTLYDYLLRLTRDGKLDDARLMLEELRDTWRAALRPGQESPGTRSADGIEPLLRA